MKTPSSLNVLSAALLAGLLVFGPAAPAQDAPGARGGQDNEQPLRDGFVVPVPLPITADSAAKVKQTIQRYIESVPATAVGNLRPVMILEFDTRNSVTGQGSELEACWALARLLTDQPLNRIQTVAYIPEPRGYADTLDDIDRLPLSQLKGHAVLVALACESIVMHQDAAIGEAGIDEAVLDSSEREIYRSIAAKRIALPVAVALSMVDKAGSLYRAETQQGTVFVDAEELARLEREGKLIGSETISEPGSLALLTSQSLINYRLIRHRVASRRDLTGRLQIKPGSLDIDPALSQQWIGLQLNLDGQLQARNVNWLLRALEQKLAGGDANLIIVRIDSEGGDPAVAMRLADRLVNLDPNKHRTVAYVPAAAQGAASLVALSCDHLMMAGDAVLGGAGTPELTGQQLEDLRPYVQQLARAKQSDWSVWMGLVDPSLEVLRWKNKQTGEVRILCQEERDSLPDRQQWLPLGDLNLAGGMDGELAEKLFIARALTNDFAQFQSYYPMERDPEILQPTLADRWIESLARELASPWIAGWLLFGAMFLLSTELSQPGVGIPGFLGTLCLLLFFWSQYFEGNAQWLEIMLFIVGAVFIALELFVIPGIGVFGIGGLLMVVVSIVLATQTFVIPSNSEEMGRLPVSLSMVLAASAGFVVSLVLLRRYLPNLPYFKRLMLEPPSQQPSPLEPDRRDSMIDHLLSQRGTTITALIPAGKARIGNSVVDVISEGGLIEKGVEVSVCEVRGNRVVVRPVDGDA